GHRANAPEVPTCRRVRGPLRRDSPYLLPGIAFSDLDSLLLVPHQPMASENIGIVIGAAGKRLEPRQSIRITALNKGGYPAEFWKAKRRERVQTKSMPGIVSSLQEISAVSSDDSGVNQGAWGSPGLSSSDLAMEMAGRRVQLPHSAQGAAAPES